MKDRKTKLDVVGQTAMLEVPLADFPESSYAARHVETQLTREQAKTLKRVFIALDHGGATLSDGKPVRRSCDVLKYLLDQISVGAE